MIRYFIVNRKREKDWKKHIPVHIVGLILCLTILVIAMYEKFLQGGWLTLAITTLLIIICYRIHNHYETVKKGSRELDEMLLDIPTSGSKNVEPLNPKEMTAVVLVNDYNGFGVHTLLSVIRNFPKLYKNFIFISVAVVDSGSFKGAQEVDALKDSVEESLKKYVDIARRFGFPADYRMDVGTEVIDRQPALPGGGQGVSQIHHLRQQADIH